LFFQKGTVGYEVYLGPDTLYFWMSVSIALVYETKLRDYKTLKYERSQFLK